MGGPPTRETTDAAHKATFIEQARRRQIVDAAVEVLAEHGLAGTTFTRIAERAGISPALISYHFSGKAQLLNQVVESISEAMDSAITAAIGEPESYQAAIRGLIESQVRYFAEHTTEVLALGKLYEISGSDPLAAGLQDNREKSITELEEMFREGQAEGELRLFPTRPMAVTLLVALEAVPAELLGSPGVDPDEYASALADIFDAATRR